MEPDQSSIRRDAIPSLEEVEAYLRAAEPSPSTDDYINEFAERVFDVPEGSQATQALIVALDRAQYDLTRRSIALALGLCATSQSSEAVDALVSAYQQCNNDAFLAPSLLEALGILALRNSLARAEITVALLRLEPNGPRYLLIKAAKIIGRLDNAQADAVLRSKLQAFCTAADFAVQSEAYYQLGLIGLAEALLAPEHTELHQRLKAAQALFVQAEMAEETRDDAALFHILTDAVVAVHALTGEPPDMARRVAQDIEHLQIELQQINTRLWSQYRSPATDLIAVRILGVVDALKRTTLSTSTAEDWTNFDAALIELATLHALIRSQTPVTETSSRINTAISVIADRVLSPQLGPVAIRAVGRRRLSLVVERYRLDPSHDPNITTSLQKLEQVALLSETVSTSDDPPGHSLQIDELTTHLNKHATELLQNFYDAVDSNSVDRFIEKLGLPVALLPIDRPDLYGSDPTIDRTVRSLLFKLRAHFEAYPTQQWHRLIEVIEALANFIHYVRDTMPGYTLCREDEGKGQGASERDLQEHLFEALRLRFNRNVSYEHMRIGGGRPDNGLRFPECFFPIEVKHEFHSISPQSIHEHYLAQADIYAAATDRVAFLMVLDLRDSNVAGHVERVKERRKRGQPAIHTSLYTLEEGFWVDALPIDPQLPHMRQKAVIVGLVPGNRPRPSSTTTYSKRPAAARKKSPL